MFRQLLYVQCRAVVTANGGQLCRVADQQQLVPGGGEDVLEEVRQQVAIECAAAALTDHTGLVHYEERMLFLVGCHGDAAVAAVIVACRAIDAPVDGAGGSSSISAEHFGCTARWGQQHHGFARFGEHLHQSTY